MMPKGVEHADNIYAIERAAKQVIYPLMPKGVEHNAFGRCPRPLVGVIYPLMPKGVEHASRVKYLEFGLKE